MSDFAKSRVFLLLALAIAALLATASAVAFTQSGDDEPDVALPTAAPTTSETPSATPSPTSTLTPEPSPAATATATATTTATADPSAAPTRRPTTGPSTRTFAYPKPSQSYERLKVRVTANPGSGDQGTVFEIVSAAEDGDGTIYFSGLTWGDGASERSQPSPRKCKSYPPLTSPPGAYQPDPDKKTYTFSHRYTEPGTYKVVVTITSVNADCRPNGPANDVVKVEIPITVTKAQPTPTAIP
jgi:hypothetical protein